MAYIDDEQFNQLNVNGQRDQGLPSGNQIISPSSQVGGGAGGAAQNVQRGPTNSGNWTNVESYLNANPSIGGQIVGKGEKDLTAEKSSFDTAATPLRSATYTPTVYNEETLRAELDPSSPNYNPTKAKSGFSNMYGGPQSFSYDINKSGNINSIKGLTNKDTAVDTLNSPHIKAGKYTLGERTLDSGLLGADNGYQEKSKNLWGNTQNFITEAANESNTLDSKAKGFTKSASDANAANRVVAGTLRTNINKTLDDKTNAAKSELQKSKEAYAKKYANWYNIYSNPIGGPLDPRLPAPIGKQRTDPINRPDYTPNPTFHETGNPYANVLTPSVSNVGSDSEYAISRGLSDILGDNNYISRDGTFSVPAIKNPTNKSEAPGWAAADGHVMTVEEIRQALGLN